MVRIGFDVSSEQGPGIFLSRLKTELEKNDQFSRENPDVWIQLSFHDLPQDILLRKQQGLIKTIVRMDGCYAARHHKFSGISVPVLDDWYSAKINRKKNRQIRENLLSADAIIFQSEFSRQLTWKFVTKTPPGIVIHNGIDLNAFTPEGSKSSLINTSGNTLNILMSHSFKIYHRLHDAFRILERLKAMNDKLVHLYILGGDDGESFAYGKKIADECGLSEGNEYTFLGKHAFTQLAAIYRSCDAMLNLSFQDACPNVVIEAMACGLPVIGVDRGGVAELVGDSGVLVQENIPFTFVEISDVSRIPPAPVEVYARGLSEVVKDLTSYREKTRQRAQTCFNIEQTALRYTEYAHQVHTAHATIFKKGE